MKEKQKKQIVNYYEVLGVKPDAPVEEINKAFRKLALQFHPDKCEPSQKEEFETKFKGFVEAHDILKDVDKRKNYDRVRLRPAQNESDPTSISGYITTYLLPLSHHYKQAHIKALQTKAVPQKKQVSKGFVPVTPEVGQKDFFEALRTPLESKEPCELITFKDTLTPSYAFILFEDFLKGKYTGENYDRLKAYFQTNLLALERSNNSTLTVDLYEGFLSLIQIVEDNAKRKDIYASINKIIQYARSKQPTASIKPVEKLAQLFQQPVFRALYAAGMQQQWQTPLDIDCEVFFQSQLDEVLESDTQGQKESYLHTLYIAQEDIYQKYATLKKEAKGNLNAAQWRELAFYSIDYFAVISGNKQMTINQLLQVAVFFKKAAECEANPKLQFADESLIIQACLLMLKIAEHDKIFLDAQAHHYTLNLLSTLNFDHPGLNILLEFFTKDMLKIIDFFPYHPQLKSNLDLLEESSKEIKYVCGYLETLMQWVKERKKDLTLKKTTVLNATYEASIKGMFPFDEEKEKKLHRRLMKAFLEEEGGSFLDISKNMHPDWVMANIDSQGWFKPDEALPFAKVLNTYQSLEGAELNVNNGTVGLVLKPWTPNDPAYTKAFSDSDLMQLFKLSSGDYYFSLDPADKEYRHHPFQKIVYGPASLKDTELLNTLFFTDYLLKFFATGYEVQAQYPYDFRSVQSLISKLPKPLQEVITTFHKNKKKNGKVHRFWLETSSVPTLKRETPNGIQWSFGNPRILIKKHGMEFDREGKLVDSKEKPEGWAIYLVNNIEDFEKEKIGKDFNFKALVFVKNSDQVYSFEEQVLSKKPYQVVLPEPLKQELLVQKWDQNGLLIRGSDFKNKDDKMRYENYHFIYQFTTYVCKQINKPTYFSAERIFAGELTENYDVIAQCFPEFERLKQLSRVIAATKELNGYYLGNEDLLQKAQQRYHDHAEWAREEFELRDRIYKDKQADFKKLFTDVSSMYSSHISQETTRLQKIRTDMGGFTFTEHSPEVRAHCNEVYADIEKNIKADHGDIIWQQQKDLIWPEIITPKIPSWVAQFNAAGATKKANYRQQVVNLFPEISSFLGSTEFNNRVTQFMENNISPLARAICDHAKQENINNLKKQFASIYPGISDSNVTTALNGNGEPLAKEIAQREANRVISDAKTQVQAAIHTKLKLQKQFRTLGFGLEGDPKDSQILETKPYSSWVPSISVHSRVNSDQTSFVYGGVYLRPSVMCQLEANRYSMKLQMPSSFGVGADIREAEGFLRNLKSTASQFSPRVDTSAIDQMARDLEHKINRAQFEQTMNSSSTSSFGPTMTSTPDYGFRQTTLPDLPIIDLLSGLTGKVRYTIFKSDSIICAVNKSEINEMYGQAYNGSDPLETPRLLRYIARLEELTQGITQYCHPATPEDLRQINPLDKSFPDMSVRDLRAYILNQFEKSRSHSAGTGRVNAVNYPEVLEKMTRNSR